VISDGGRNGDAASNTADCLAVLTGEMGNGAWQAFPSVVRAPCSIRLARQEEARLGGEDWDQPMKKIGVVASSFLSLACTSYTEINLHCCQF